VPFSDVGPIVIPDGLDDDTVLFLSDILPTGWMAAENCDIEPGDTVAVWGAARSGCSRCSPPSCWAPSG
jgi:threonine dehydrogenase-like Zn-dependent dehydrogenase